ncbi:Glycosyl transferase family 2 [Kandleria vitulina]|uniref:glycosyltransferase family 2 protein n=1 Tax=Kandleria vitulina TaxID=1630 RepID=UPI0008C4CB63|nr:glycosyltransferase family 2 protein [Kandleria vitulina]SEI98990.1 Glycosyl transferase family 2 [Kandleria vitulina]
MISVIIPVYNSEKYIEKCINSILNSSFNDFEIIVVDDGSIDETYNIISKLSKKDKRIRIIKISNGGSAHARNIGLQNVRGDYVTFVDSDDYVDKDYLKELYEAIVTYNLDMVECDYRIISNYEDYNEIIQNKKNHIYIIDNIAKLNQLCERNTYLKSVVLWNKIYKKELFDNIQFVENKGIDDEYIIHKIIYKAKKIGLIENKLYNYYVNNNSQMRGKPDLKRLDNLDAIESQLCFFDEKKLYSIKEKLLFRYYRTVIDDIYFVKKYFPNEKNIINDLKKKRKGWSRILLSGKISIKEKVYLILTRYFSSLAYYIRNRIIGNNKVISN